MAGSIADILSPHEEKIVSSWVESLRTLENTSFVARGSDEIRSLCASSFRALLPALSGSFSPLRGFIADVCPVLVSRGFRLAESERALLAFKEVAWPYLGDSYHDDLVGFMNAVQRVDNCLSTAVFEFSETFQSVVNLDVRRYVHEVEHVNRKLEQLAIHDSLTGLYNYRYFHDRLHEELLRADRYRRALGLVMIDVDYFKRFNDTYGHPAGDRVIQRIAEQIRASIREVDIAARYGGEEFAVILPETDSPGAVVAAERIRANIADAGSLFENEPPATISAGVASFPMDARCADDLIVKADRALYHAKRIGRNCVMGSEREA